MEKIKKLKDFKRVGVKQRGVMAGGIYEDANKNRWVIKEGHYANLRGHPTAIEFIAGKLYQILLREGAAKTILVYDELNHKVMIGSKMIPNVKTLFDFNTSNNNFKYDYYNNRYLQVDFNKLYNGSKVRNYADTVVSIGFLLDMDKHAENLLVQDVGNGQVICVIDHGLAFNSDTSLTLAKLHEYLKEKQVTLDGINMISYQELHDAMARIANVSVDELKLRQSERSKLPNYT